MKFNKEYLVHINLDIPEPEELDMTKEEYEGFLKDAEENVPDVITKGLYDFCEGFKTEVETSEVKRGKWIYTAILDSADSEMKCSNCGHTEMGLADTIVEITAEYEYCPICGAKMEEF